MTDVGTDRRVRGDGGDDVVDALVPLVVRVVDAGRLRRRRHADEQVTEIAIVDQRPVILARTDDPHETVGRVLEQIPDDAARTAVDDAGTDDDRAQPGA